MICVWTDGSHIKGTTTRGIGIYMEWDQKTAEYSAPVEAADDSSNPTLELLAAVTAVEWLLRYPEKLGDSDGVCIFSDYDGVSKYANGDWCAARAKKNTGWFRTMALKWEAAVERLRQLCIVEVKWVKGHGSDEGNKKADRLAKSGRTRNTIPALFA